MYKFNSICFLGKQVHSKYFVDLFRRISGRLVAFACQVVLEILFLFLMIKIMPLLEKKEKAQRLKKRQLKFSAICYSWMLLSILEYNIVVAVTVAMVVEGKEILVVKKNRKEGKNRLGALRWHVTWRPPHQISVSRMIECPLWINLTDEEYIWTNNIMTKGIFGLKV